MDYKKKNRVKKAFTLPSNSVVMSMMAVILVCAAPALIAIIDSENSTQDFIVEGDISPYFADAGFSGYWSEKPKDVTISYDGIFDGNSAVITADYDDFAGMFTINNIDSSLLTDIAKIEVRSSVPLSPSIHHSAIALDEGSRFAFSISEDGVLTFSPSSVELINIRNSETFHINFDPDNTVDTLSVIELEFTLYYQYTIPYGEIIIGATGVLLMVCALLATPWFGTSGLTIKRRR